MMHSIPIIMTGLPTDVYEFARNRLITLGANSIEIALIPNSEDDALKIDHVRQLKAFISTYPAMGTIKGIIVRMDSATEEAQNALLKLLEEPPSYASIILLIQNIHSLLPTIVSRARIENVSSNKDHTIQPANNLISLQTILHNSLGERLSAAQQIAQDRQKTVEWLKNSITSLHHLFVSQDSVTQRKTATLLRTLQRAKHTLSKTSTNPRLLLENLFLELNG